MELEGKKDGEVVFMIFLAISASFLNLAVIAVFICGYKLIPRQNLSLLSLTIADLTAVIAYVCGTFGEEKVSCVAAAYVICLASYTSISHMVTLSMQRVLMLLFPFKAIFASKKFVISIIALSWSHGILWATFPFFKWGEYTQEAVNRCSINVRSSSPLIRSYNYDLFVFCYVAPLVVCIASFLFAKKEVQRMSTTAKAQNGKKSALALDAAKQEKQMTLMFTVMILSFFLAWTPYTVCLFVELTTGYIPTRALDIAAYIGKCSTLINPIIYVFMMKEFRTIAAKTFLACFQCKKLSHNQRS